MEQPQQVMPKSPKEVKQVASNEAEKKPPSQKEVKDEIPPIDDWNEEITKKEENSKSRNRRDLGGQGGFKGGRKGKNGYRGNGKKGYHGNGENGSHGGQGRNRDRNFRDSEFRSSNHGGQSHDRYGCTCLLASIDQVFFINFQFQVSKIKFRCQNRQL